MRTLVISDIHANVIALDTVLEHAGEVDQIWCLGDVVGYGPNPNECIERLKEFPNLVCLLGNHDAAAVHKVDVTTFNPEARISIEWMQTQLTEESIEFINQLPEQKMIGEVTLAHGSPRQPTYEYLLDTRAASENFEHFNTSFCFVGHTHLPVLFSLEPEDFMSRLSIPLPNQVSTLQPRAIINPGSVGQPRDRDPRAAYAIFDTEENTWDYRRIEYDIPAVQERMLAAGLPERHISRLEAGW
ncbi:MAG: metallophosphatase family protein [Anaerolineae bacterium]|nr:metallophosphatase family protein [Anaerolineae bacterium]